ncbi:MAG: putative dehydrogenase [Myxococcaceae bacterium]|nr:putative dehydrogenase [Myxococcaceae bacterium]
MTSAEDKRASQPGAEQVEASTPELPEQLSLGAPARSAAGIPAVLSTLRHARRDTGLWRGAKLLLQINQKDGFDCQSCAWPNPEQRHVAEFCENGAKAALDEATERRIDARFFAQHSLSELSRQSDFWLGQQGRLTEPMIRKPGASHYEPIDWEAAFALIGQTLRGLASPNEAIFYTSGRTSNEAAFLYQLFVRLYGTNNLPDCSNMCHESSGSALGASIGVGKGTVSLEDFDQAEAIFIFGQNPGTNHPRMLSALQSAKRRGCKIVNINPLPEAGSMRFKNPQEVLNTLFGGTRLADLFLQVRIGGDLALLKGIMKEMLLAERERGGVFDREFIADHTLGYEQLTASLDQTSWEDIEHDSGLTRQKLREASEIACSAKSIICCWAMGLTQNRHAVATIQELVNMLLLRGNIGRAGAGVCPVRGHSNVQGDRTMGIYEKPPAELLDSLERRFGSALPRAHGFDVVASILAMHEGRARVFFGLGGNFLSATPDTELTARALSRCDLTVQVSTKLNRGHLVTGRTALILPCLGRSERDRQASGEQFVTVEDSMSIIASSRGRLEPAAPGLRSEPAIIAGVAQSTLGARGGVDWSALSADYDRIRDHIEAVVPGFEGFNRRIRAGTFLLPNAARERIWHTPSGRASFVSHPLPRLELERGELVMMTIRSHDQFNTTIYGLDDRYRGIYGGRRVILMQADDMTERGLVEGDRVDVSSHFAGVRRVAPSFTVVPFSLPRGSTAMYYPEANVLVPVDSVAAISNTPTSKYVRITVEKSGTQTRVGPHA